MSDPFHDAHRPANKPKGFGWWDETRKRAHAIACWARGDRDEWLVAFLLPRKLISRAAAAEALGIDLTKSLQLELHGQ